MVKKKLFGVCVWNCGQGLDTEDGVYTLIHKFFEVGKDRRLCGPLAGRMEISMCTFLLRLTSVRDGPACEIHCLARRHIAVKKNGSSKTL